MQDKKSITQFRFEYKFLSNFFETPIEFENEIYPTVEHAFQAAKTLNLNERIKTRAKTK